MNIKFDYLQETDIKKMHEASLEVLEKTGIKASSPRFLAKAKELGLRVDKKEDESFGKIYFTKEQVETALKSAPKKFSIYGLDEKNEVKWGEQQAYSHTCVGTPFIIDVNTRKKRNTTLKDLEDYIRLADALPDTDIISCLTAQNIPEHAANAVQTGAMVKNTTKPLRICIESAHETKHVVDVLSAAVGSLEKLQEKPIAYLEICSISPLDYANNPAEALMDIVEAGVPLGIIPCPMMGATGPMTLIGSVVMHNAEILAGVTFAQLMKPGHPTIMSPRVTFMNMSTAMGLWAAPEMGLAAAASLQLIRFYEMPSTATGFSCASKTSDAQAGFESMYNSLLPAMIGVDVLGAAGSLDNVLIASFEKLLIDNEVAALVKRAIKGEVVNDDTMAISVIDDVVNGEGNFLGHEHTLKHLRSELWEPYLSNRNIFENWETKGKDFAQEAQDMAIHLLETHKVSPLSPQALKAVEEVIAKAIGEK